ncbi:GNAT family N-acetyltransferase [Sulfuriferula thiophila]|uniref:GNAT family N-acetyltransferase n=1 Tax=Sulfuriferula thiophila TaxID=1781211 RepID=UPI001674B0AF|nr:GNAT family N-acetyltransferase [Sulfuriferula thiophila]
MNSCPELNTQRLLLRPFMLSDAGDVQRLAGDCRIADMTQNVPHPYEDGAAECWISGHALQFATGNSVTFAIVLQASGELVGCIGLRIKRDFDNAELGYWIGCPYWGQGYCTEAGEAVIEYAFTELGMNRIHATHFSRNQASGRVMEKLGMQMEGMLRQHVKKCGQYEDVVVRGLLRG